MATELDRLFVTLEADLTNYQNGLKRAGVDLDTFAKDVERKAGDAGKAIGAGLGDGMKKAGASAGVVGQQFTQLGYQLNDITTGLLSGQSPFTILAQQGGQVYQALSMGGGVQAGLARVKDAIVGAITPTTLLAGGFAAAGIAAVVAGVQFAGAQDDISRSLKGIGSASGATVRDINAIADRLAATRNIGVGAARDIATSLVATGKIDVSNIASIADLAPGLAKITGTSLDEAGQKLAKIFADPVAGAKEFIGLLGGVNAATLRTIENLSEQGKRQEAIVALRNAVQPKIEAAITPRSVVGQIYDAGKSYASRAYNYVGEAVSAPLDEKPLEKRLEEARARFEGARDRAASSGTRFPQELKADLEALERQFAKVGEAKKKALNEEDVADLSIQTQPVFDKMNPDGELLRQLQNRAELVGQLIAKVNLDPDSKDAKLLDDYIARYGALQKGVDAVTAAQAKGGLAAKQAGDQADFAKQVASLSNYERGLRQILFQYEQLAKQQELVGNTSAAQGFRDVKTQAVAAYDAQNVERARGEIGIPPGYLDTIRAAESGTDDRAISKTGAVGRYQFIKSTWLSLFQDVKSSRYGEIQKANTKADGTVDQEAVEAAVLALRNDPNLQEELVRALTIRNAADLDKRGIPATSRNLYGAHNIGPAGITALVKAQDEGRGGTNAQSILDPIKPSLVSSNPEYYGKGKSVDQALATLERKTLANSASARSAREDTIATQAQTQAMGMSGAEAAKLKSINDDLRISRENNGEAGLKFATANDLLKASSTGLSGTLKAETDQILANAEARSKAVSQSLDTRYQQDQKAAREALGRTYEEQAAFSGAKAYGAPGSSAFNEAKAGIQEIQGLTEAKNYTGSFLKDLNYDLMQSKSLGEAALSSLNRLLSRVADKALDKLVSSLFAPAGAGTSIFSGVAKFFGGGFAAGGYTGSGAVDEPAGVVHREEVVWSKKDVQRAGGVGVVEAMRKGLRGYLEGGVVGRGLKAATIAAAVAAPLPAMPMANAPNAVPSQITDARSYAFDMRGSTLTEAQARAMFTQALAANNADRDRTTGQRFAAWRENATG